MHLDAGGVLEVPLQELVGGLDDQLYDRCPSWATGIISDPT